MEYKIIGSSSKGNCIILEKIIMLDCGVSFKKIKSDLKKIKCIFISHIHKDHLNPTTISSIKYERPTIKFICGNKTVLEALIRCGVMPQNIIYVHENIWYSIGLFKFMVQKVCHDTPNNCIHININNKKCLYIVDTKHVENIVAKKYDLYLIEGNYEEQTLKENRELFDKNFEYDYLYRVENTHLSVSQAMNFLVENMGDSSVYQLIHQSELNIRGENNE